MAVLTQNVVRLIILHITCAVILHSTLVSCQGDLIYWCDIEKASIQSFDSTNWAADPGPLVSWSRDCDVTTIPNPPSGNETTVTDDVCIGEACIVIQEGQNVYFGHLQESVWSLGAVIGVSAASPLIMTNLPASLLDSLPSGQYALPKDGVVSWLDETEDGHFIFNGFATDTSRQVTWSTRLPFISAQVTATIFDPRNNILYVAEKTDRSILGIHLPQNGIDETFVSVVTTGTSGVVGGLALDLHAGAIYWSDSLLNQISVAGPLQDGGKDVMKRTLIDSGTNTPSALTISSSDNVVVWSDHVDGGHRIHRMDSLGSNRTVLVQGLTQVLGITVDDATHMVFWNDGNTIEGIHLDGSSRKTFTLNSNIAIGPGLESVQGKVYVQGMNMVWQIDIPSLPNPSSTAALNLNPFMRMRSKGQVVSSGSASLAGFCSALGCQHFCVSSVGGLQCVCADGYTLNADGKQCTKNNSPDPVLVFLSAQRLCYSPVVPTIVGDVSVIDRNCLLFQRERLRHIAANSGSRRVFVVTESGLERRIRNVDLFSRNYYTPLVGVWNFSGVAYDWVSHAIFYGDLATNQIQVATSNGAFITTIVSNTSRPISVTVDPTHGKLYWIEETTGRIMTSNTDGSDVMTLIETNATSVSRLTLDVQSDRLFWVQSGDTIKSASLDGTSLRVETIVIGNIKALISVKGYLVFAMDISGEQRKVIVMEKSDFSTVKEYTTTDPVEDITLLDAQSQPQIPSPCSTGNGGCEQLCLTTSAHARVCACVDHMDLGEDNQTCKPKSVQGDIFFLVASWYQRSVFQISSDLTHVSALNIPPQSRPLSLAYDVTREMIYFGDLTRRRLARFPLAGGSVEIVWNFPRNARVEGMAVDSASGLLYYTDGLRHRVGVCRLNGTNHRTLINSGIFSPRAIALYPEKGLMFLTSRHRTASSSLSKIARSNMDGTAPVTLVSDVTSPTGLALDKTEQKLYWCDRTNDRIGVVDIAGGYNKILHTLRHPEFDLYPFGLAVGGGYVYWTDWQRRGIGRMLKNGTGEDYLLYNELQPADDLLFVDKNSGVAETRCSVNNGNCSHLCVPAPTGVKCLCPDIVPKEDTCISDVAPVIKKGKEEADMDTPEDSSIDPSVDSSLETSMNISTVRPKYDEEKPFPGVTRRPSIIFQNIRPTTTTVNSTLEAVTEPGLALEITQLEDGQGLTLSSIGIVIGGVVIIVLAVVIIVFLKKGKRAFVCSQDNRQFRVHPSEKYRVPDGPIGNKTKMNHDLSKQLETHRDTPAVQSQEVPDVLKEAPSINKNPLMQINSTKHETKNLSAPSTSSDAQSTYIFVLGADDMPLPAPRDLSRRETLVKCVPVD